MSKYCIIIPSYNEGNNLLKILNYLLDEVKDSYERLEAVYLVFSNDKDSNDFFDKFLEKIANNNKVVVIKEKNREGKSKAIRKALEISCADIIIVHSADCFADRGFINKINEIFDNYKEIGGIVLQSSPITKSHNLSEDISAHYWYLLNSTFEELDKNQEITQLGCDIYAFKRVALAKLPDYVINEDAYIALQILRKGYRIKFIKDIHSYILTASRIDDILKQRERIIVGHRLNLKVTKMNIKSLKLLIFAHPIKALKIIYNYVTKNAPKSFYIILFILFIETISTIIGYTKWFLGEDFVKWKVAYTTKYLDLVTLKKTSK